MNKTFGIFGFLAVLCVASAVEVRECQGISKPTEVRVDGCEVLPCEFQKGTIAGIEADGSYVSEITSLNITSKVTWNGIEIELPQEDIEGCDLLVGAITTCPIPPQTSVTIRQEIEIPALLPEAELVLQVTVFDQNKEAIICFEGDIKIVN